MGRSSIVLLGLFLTACGVAGVRAVTPGSEGYEAQIDSPLRIVEEKGTSQAEAPDFDLTQFRPLLSEERYKKVRALVDQGSQVEAAEALHKVLSSDGAPTGLERLRAHFLLGRLWVEAKNEPRALAAFTEVSSIEWTLRDDALLRVAELEIRAGKPERALASLAEARSLADKSASLRLRAEARVAMKSFEEAVADFRALVSLDDDSDTRLRLAHALLLWAESVGTGPRRLELAEEAAFESQLAAMGHKADEEIAKQSHEVTSQAKTLGARADRDLSLEQKLLHLRGLLDSFHFEEGEEYAQSISFPPNSGYTSERCEYDYLVGKTLAGLRRWGEAAERTAPAAEKCTAPSERHSWLLFNAGKYAAADGRHTQAVKLYAELERLYPKSSLADDARLRAARSYETAGVMAQFVSLLLKMPEDYPDGDMTMEGVLTLALHRIERGDWASAAQVLERGASVVRDRDSARGHEYSGTERYFLARAQEQLGQKEAALSEYESIVVEVPLSYYMLHAYSRLLEADPDRARAALESGLERARTAPFSFPHRPEYESAEFLRGMELLRVGDIERGRALLDEVGLSDGADDSLLWGLALLYDRAGDAHTSHSIARGRLTDWFAHYPEADWQGAWEIGFPRPYHSIVERESQATGVPEWLIYGVMREESTFKAAVVSHADAYGLMQVIPPTARGIAKKSGHPTSPAALKMPSVNIAIGSRVLQELARRFRQNPWLAIPGYNAGPGNPSKWLRERPNVDFDVWVEMIPYRETRRYTKRVLASRAAYAFLYYREEAKTALILPRRLSFP